MRSSSTLLCTMYVDNLPVTPSHSLIALPLSRRVKLSPTTSPPSSEASTRKSLFQHGPTSECTRPAGIESANKSDSWVGYLSKDTGRGQTSTSSAVKLYCEHGQASQDPHSIREAVILVQTSLRSRHTQPELNVDAPTFLRIPAQPCIFALACPTSLRRCVPTRA